EKMIRLSGFKPYTDIDIKVTGLRPGEKLYEELLIDKTKTLTTHHKKIMIAKDEALKIKYVNMKFQELENAVLQMDDTAVVRVIKELVPEYISNNSVYEILDKASINGS
ncbi:MAG: polysaccharide biosynthesis protein, partial [Nonlabens sp.]|nr:polysaccharide biosynthesis protein [Nonlabens sp.]